MINETGRPWKSHTSKYIIIHNPTVDGNMSPFRSYRSFANYMQFCRNTPGRAFIPPSCRKRGWSMMLDLCTAGNWWRREWPGWTLAQLHPAEEAIEISAILAFESTNLEAHIGTICLSWVTNVAGNYTWLQFRLEVTCRRVFDLSCS